MATRHTLATMMRSQLLHTLVRLGETEQFEKAFAELDAQAQDSGAVRTPAAAERP